MWIRVCRYKNAGVAGYAEAFIPVQSDSQASEWYRYFENDVLVSTLYSIQQKKSRINPKVHPARQYFCYSSLVVSCRQIPCSHENLCTKNHEESAILWAKMSCEAAESIEDALLRMARVNWNYNSQFFTVLGKGMTSRMLPIPVRYITQRSNPRPKPAWLAEPYFLRSR